MSLLQKASIITTPTAYAEDYLYSIKPALKVSDTELVTNGTFDTDSDWTKGTGWSIANGKASFDGGADAALTQSNVVQPSTLYRVLFTVLDRTTGSLQLRLGNSGVVDVTVDSNSDFTFDLTTDTSGTSVYFRAIGGFDGSIDNVSVKEIIQADFDFDRNSTGTRVNEDYLIEDVPYNICRNTEVFNNWTKIGTPTIEDNNIIAPNGTLTGAKVTRGSNATPLRLGSVTFLNQQYTYSIYAKKGNHNQINIDIGDETGATYTLTDDWQRFTVTSTPTANTHIDITLPSSTSGDFIYVWGAQVVKGDQPKDYLKTTDRLDIPRIDYTNGEPSILLEPSRTNQSLHSNDISQLSTSVLKNGSATITTTGNYAKSPDGTNNSYIE